MALVLALGLAQLAAAAAAVSPGAPFTNATGVSWRPSPAAQRNCGRATMAADPGLDAADWRQCAALYSLWTSQNGTLSVDNAAGAGPSYRPVVAQTDCALVVAPLAATDGPYLMGSQDIEVMLQCSLAHFSSGSSLAVNGTVECDVASGGRAPMSWRICKPSRT